MFESAEPVEGIARVFKSKGPSQIAAIMDQPEIRIPPDKEKFDAAMQQVNLVDKVPEVSEVSQVSLMDQIKALNTKVRTASEIDPQELADQSKGVIAEIQDLRTRLSSPDLEANKEFKRVLTNKLENLDGDLRTALQKAGLEYVPPQLAILGEDVSPVRKFLALLTNGQENLKSLGGELQMMAASDKQTNPADLLMIQVKVNYIQQEMEFFTSLLNKALESTKTIMNVQV